MRRLDAETRERIVATSEGNPLFVEEMLAMVRERAGDDEIVVPPTIHALLQARLDALDARRARRHRARLGRGRDLPPRLGRRAGSRLGRAGGRVAPLDARAKGADPPRPAAFVDDEAFRFRHLLIRDAAYESLPKATRAELHEQFADWLETTSSSSGTRSSATTSSRRTATAPSSTRRSRPRGTGEHRGGATCRRGGRRAGAWGLVGSGEAPASRSRPAPRARPVPRGDRRRARVHPRGGG